MHKQYQKKKKKKKKKEKVGTKYLVAMLQGLFGFSKSSLLL